MLPGIVKGEISNWRETTLENKFIPATSVNSGKMVEIQPDLQMYTVQIVNLFFVGSRGDWVLVDAGMPQSAEEIVQEAEKLFGEGAKPKAIVLTHGHFDHVGALEELIQRWDVDVYAHEQELPFLTGKQDYPKPDASVEGGMVAKISPMFPHEAIDISGRVHALPADGTVPPMPGWEWIHTPGHSPGHVSLFRPSDKVLLAGDAFVTVKQDALYNVLTQKKEFQGPPRYLTTDWQAAKQSVIRLAELQPDIAATGHGEEARGEELRDGLAYLVNEFDQIAIPDYGRYVEDNDK
ncbi:MBL fold metallo-hydrolase [Bacillus thermotolerans]|uniref:MBL fold metallo-hydrolase n=1 Tax=Bacillus thermotolerans TaxID=1221996 RepID=UPI00061726B9|nr:MBL fold metallo-hydrolase [Bacillus thermotolerans]